MRMLGAALLLLGALHPLRAQTTGTVLGRVLDADTGEPLADALVEVPSLDRQTVTRADGRFVLAGVSAGERSLRVRLIGYRALEVASLRVGGGQPTEVELRLAPQAVPLNALEVQAEQTRLIEPEVVETHEVLVGRELRELPVTTVQDAIELTTGVSGGHFRGGRIGQETYVVDGLPIKNQLEASSEGPELEYAPNALEQVDVMTGGVPAEYGNQLAGVVSYVTRRGNPDHWEGESSVLTDQWAPSSLFTGFTSATLAGGGPLPFLGTGTTLFADVWAQGMRDSDPRGQGLTCLRPGDAAPDLATRIQQLSSDPATAGLVCPYTRDALPHQGGDKLIGFARLDRPLGGKTTLTATVLHDRIQQGLYTPEFKYNPTYQLGQRTRGTLGTLTLDYTSNERGQAFHLVTRLAAERLDRYLGVLDPAAMADRSTVAGFGLSDYRFLGEDFVRSPIRRQLAALEAVPGYVVPGGSVLSPFGPAAEGIFDTGGASGIANWSRSDFVGGNVVAELLTASGSAYRAGADGKLYRAQVYERSRSYLVGSSPNYARFYPATLGGFVEGHVKPEPLLAFDFGLRVQGFRSGLDFRRDRTDFLAPVIDTKWKVAVLPRFGLAGTAESGAGRSAFRFSYSELAQPPDFQFFVDNTIGDSLRTDIRRQGNPNLAFEKGRSFEFGLSQLFPELGGGGAIGVSLTLFRRELTDLVTGNITFSDAAPGQFTTGDHGTVEGAELTVRGGWPILQLRAGYSLQRARGITSTAIDDTTLVRADQVVEYPLAFDRRHSINLAALAGSAAGDSTRSWGAALAATVESGYPVSREIASDPTASPPEFQRLPWTATVDVKLSRRIARGLPGCARCRLRLVLDGRNLLGLDNIRALRRDSGLRAPSLATVEALAAGVPDTGFPIPRESPRYGVGADLNRDGLITRDEYTTARFAAALDRNDPSLLFGEARQLRLGMELRF